MKKNETLRKRLDVLSYILSVAVLLLVVIMRQPEYKISTSIDFSFLPPIHATFNIVVALFLVAALYFVKKKNIKAHRNAIFGAMIFSALFLLSYVMYHFTTEETRYCFQGFSRTIYFIILISHIILAGISLPFILLTFSRGISFTTVKHKKMARWVYPVWLYVAITGPVAYFMLRPCYG